MLGNPHICGGMIISFDPPIVLTAAHCVADSPHPSTFSDRPNPYFVGYGHKDRKHQKITTISDWKVHPSYQPNPKDEADMHYDTALVWLAKPLIPSTKVDRIALWSPTMNLDNKKATLMGYGYVGNNRPESLELKQLRLEITQFKAKTKDMIEAKSSDDNFIACHGDSGGPLVVYMPVSKDNSPSVLMPFVLGPLARIFGVHDPDKDHPTCPIPLTKQSKNVTITESFTNISNMLDWISNSTGIPQSKLIDPFDEPRRRIFPICRRKGCPIREFPDTPESEDDVDDAWEIGIANKFDTSRDSQDVAWMGLIQQDFPNGASNGSSRVAAGTDWILWKTGVLFVLIIYFL
ncbi:trypsin-like cysteine/serine peptidase domain-containing protein [Phycomyces nitens]|nr:trypsin-like cysteine/serine peptidase domain-containing protein [Phycomyces nitens]